MYINIFALRICGCFWDNGTFDIELGISIINTGELTLNI